MDFPCIRVLYIHYECGIWAPKKSFTSLCALILWFFFTVSIFNMLHSPFLLLQTFNLSFGESLSIKQYTCSHSEGGVYRLQQSLHLNQEVYLYYRAVEGCPHQRIVNVWRDFTEPYIDFESKDSCPYGIKGPTSNSSSIQVNLLNTIINVGFHISLTNYCTNFSGNFIRERPLAETKHKYRLQLYMR